MGWSQYRDDIQESQEAGNLLKTLNSSYAEFQGQFRGAVDEFAKELNINQVKATAFADKILHLVAAMQESNIKHAKRLLDHLVEAGKKGAAMKEHVSKEMMKDIKVRENFEKGGEVYDKLKELEAKIKGDTPPSEEEVQQEFDKIDLVSVGAGLGSGRILPLSDIVDELTMIPKVPHENLKKLEKAWRDGTKDSVTILAELTELHDKKEIPSGWLSKGVDQDEKEELKEDAEGKASAKAGQNV